MHFTSFAAVAALATVVVAAPTNVQRHVLHERRESSEAWIKRDRLHSDVKLPMRIGLTQSKLDEGHEYLMGISDPKSGNYGNYLTAEEIHDFFAPSKDSVDAVRSWLEKAGVEADRISQSVNKQWVQLDLSAWEAESLLQTKYHFFEHADSGKSTIGCDEYHVHEDVKKHIDYITPGIKLFTGKISRPADKEDLEKRSFGWGKGKPTLPPLKAPLPAPLATLLDGVLDVTCQVAITPRCIELMYNFTQATSAQPGNELGIFEDLGDVYSQTDLNDFFLTLTQNRIPQGTHPKLESVDGATAPDPVTSAGPESDLDFQISYPIIYPQNSILFQTDDPVYEANYTYAGFLNNFLDAIDGSYCTTPMPKDGGANLDPPYPHNVPGGYNKPLQCGVYKPTNVISVSYGGQESDLPPSYQKRQCAEYMKLGMQGVSFVISSGDSGVVGPAANSSDNGCINQKLYSPGFPVTCPYVTAVGATYIPPGGLASEDQEVAVTRFGSGGGFSNIFNIPSYQSSAVNNYLTKYLPAQNIPSYTNANAPGNGIFRKTGRAYPDVAAIGDNVVIFNMGAPTLIGGTSASAPVFASLLTRINDERLKKGKKPVGFVNPTLYANPSAFHDITTGHNNDAGGDCGRANNNGGQGFAVSPGWDPVTGLGTPNYPALLEVFMKLP
ncbi:hypothetical protein DOTSEDRAFT_151445 [Dothistroma septosporum NZE10]|uniref:tripeptidyl-peptidase II n=1 Tax=Dothistroma septosporum (strain NZE10 / CBS 128990) TaxID=675120 RepID=N1PNB9_DOTSN|nr:hypothetical protein DOTSEDRAFT_151445 [Dothistroma septosporum NZE10]